MFCSISFRSSGYPFGCTIAAVSAQRPMDNVKNALQNMSGRPTVYYLGYFLTPFSLPLCGRHMWNPPREWERQKDGLCIGDERELAKSTEVSLQREAKKLRHLSSREVQDDSHAEIMLKPWNRASRGPSVHLPEFLLNPKSFIANGRMRMMTQWLFFETRTRSSLG